MAAAVATKTTASLITPPAATANSAPFLSTGSADNVTAPRTTLMTVTITTNETHLNATTFPEAMVEGSGMGMVLVPFGIITVIGLAVAIVRGTPPKSKSSVCDAFKDCNLECGLD